MLTLTNPKRSDIQPIEAEALVDTGSVYLILPEHVGLQRQLDELEKRQVTRADGSRKTVPYVGPVQLKFKNRGAYVGALVMGDQVRLVLSPAKRVADVNPASPNIATGLAK